MKAEKARIPITDFMRVWCEHCRIRIDAHEERTEVDVKNLSSGLLRRTLFCHLQGERVRNTRWISGLRETRALANGLLSIGL